MNNETSTRLVKSLEYVNNTWTYANATKIENTTDVILKAATAGKQTVLRSLQIYNSDATVGTVVVVKDGSTVKWAGYVPAVSGAIEVNFDIPIIGTVNTALNFACLTTSAEVIVSAQGYQK